MKTLYRNSKTDGFGKIVIAGIIMTAIQTVAVLSIVTLLLVWVLTQDSTFGWALFWPLGVIVLNILASLIFTGGTALKMSKEF